MWERRELGLDGRSCSFWYISVPYSHALVETVMDKSGCCRRKKWQRALVYGISPRLCSQAQVTSPALQVCTSPGLRQVQTPTPKPHLQEQSYEPPPSLHLPQSDPSLLHSFPPRYIYYLHAPSRGSSLPGSHLANRERSFSCSFGCRPYCFCASILSRQTECSGEGLSQLFKPVDLASVCCPILGIVSL